jgi:hypothetical protein
MKVEHKERNRLQRAEAKVIADRLKELGLDVSIRAGAVAAWKNRRYVVSFRWVAKKGWRMDLAHPYLYAKTDLDIALDEVRAITQACEDIDKTWEAFAKGHSEKAWKAYQGTLAAHYLRLYKQAPTQNPVALQDAIQKRATKCINIARTILGPDADEAVVEQRALEIMDIVQ